MQKTVRNSTLLYLLTMLLMITVGSGVQTINFPWGLIATELLVILLPGLVFLRLARVPLAEMRLRRPNWGQAGGALLAGAGTWLFASLLDVLFAQLFGYASYLPPAAFPANAAQAALLFLALAVFPAVCEEFLFRGVFMRTYAPFGMRTAIWMSSLLFVFFHLRLQGLMALVPVALVLGFLAWRSGSLITSMLAHFANNTLAAVLMILGTFNPGLALPFPSLPAALIGLVLAALGIYLVVRASPAPALEPVNEMPVELPRFPLRSAWPLLIAALIYLLMGGAEWLVGKQPALLNMSGGLTAEPPRAAAQYRYQVRNIANDIVGSRECSFGPQEPGWLLQCREHVDGFEVVQGSSTWISGTYDLTLAVQYTVGEHGLAIETLHQEYTGEKGSTVYEIRPGSNNTLAVTVSENGKAVEQQEIPANSVLVEELPWRLSGLQFSQAYAARVPLARVYDWDQESKTNRTSVSERQLVVLGGEPVALPGGPAVTWKVSAGPGYTFWYSTSQPHLPVKIEQQNWLTYVLESSDTAE